MFFVGLAGFIQTAYSASSYNCTIQSPRAARPTKSTTGGLGRRARACEAQAAINRPGHHYAGNNLRAIVEYFLLY